MNNRDEVDIEMLDEYDFSDGVRGKYVECLNCDAYAIALEPDEELRIATAVKCYELGKLSQAKAAEVAGLTRSAFIDSLSRLKVSAIQTTSEELAYELRNS